MTTLDPTTLQGGETVDITITGATVAFRSGLDGLAVYLPDAEGRDRYVSLPLLPQITITRSVPADGVPQPGDVWTTPSGWRLFAYTDPEHALHLLATDGDHATWQWWHREHGPLTLVDRPAPHKPAEPVPSCRRCNAFLHPDSEGIWVDDAGYAKCTDDGDVHQPGGEPAAAQVAAAILQPDTLPDGPQ